MIKHMENQRTFNVGDYAFFRLDDGSFKPAFVRAETDEPNQYLIELSDKDAELRRLIADADRLYTADDMSKALKAYINIVSSEEFYVGTNVAFKDVIDPKATGEDAFQWLPSIVLSIDEIDDDLPKRDKITILRLKTYCGQILIEKMQVWRDDLKHVSDAKQEPNSDALTDRAYDMLESAVYILK